MLVTSCGNSISIAKRFAKSIKGKYTPLTIKSFPDGDIYLKYNTPLKGKKLVIVQSFQPDSTASLFNVVFAAETAKDLGAKQVILVAPYLAYMRQDKRFNPGEAISSRVMAKLLNKCIDKIITIDPHLHRYHSLKDIFTISAKKVTANSAIAQYVKKMVKDPVIFGPDSESYQWAEVIAKEVGCAASVFKKTRFSSRHVAEKMVTKIAVQGKDVVIVDDIISTGHTMMEAAKKAKKLGARTVTAIGVHGLFVENAFDKMHNYFDAIVTTNCIEHPSNGIDVTPLLVSAVQKKR